MQNADDLVVDVILAVRLVVLIATTKVEVSKGSDGKINWCIRKREASPELVKAIVEPVADIAAKAGE